MSDIKLVPARNSEVSIESLKAMADAALTIQALDTVAQLAKDEGLFYPIGKDIGRNNSRLMGKVHYKPSVYVNKDTGTAILISGGRVVGKPHLSAYDIASQGFRFKRVVE